MTTKHNFILTGSRYWTFPLLRLVQVRLLYKGNIYAVSVWLRGTRTEQPCKWSDGRGIYGQVKRSSIRRGLSQPEITDFEYRDRPVFVDIEITDQD